IMSTSREEASVITLEFDLSRDLDDAANDVRDRVFGVRRLLPTGIEEPIVSKASSDADPIIWLSLRSDRMSELDLTDYAERYIKDRLTILPGVSNVWLWGARRYAMRVWLNPERLASRRLTVQDVEDSLHDQNVAIPSGRIESDRLEFSVRTRGKLQTPEQFNRLIIAYRDGYPIRLEEVGYAELGAEDDRRLVRSNGTPIVSLGVVKQSKGNTLTVSRAVKERLGEIQSSLPDGMTLLMAGDGSRYIERSLHEVYLAMGISLALVVLVIFLFLGSVRATLIPAIAIPASIFSTFTLMYALGFSINVLTLLGLVLAVGLVVDDAIVVLENIHRRIEKGQSPARAAIEGSREIGFAVVATTISLVAVFVPIAFLTGAIGRLFSELAVAVAGSVLISGFIALTLTPMMSATMLVSTDVSSWDRRSGYHRFHLLFTGLIDRYRRALALSLRAPVWILIVGGASLAGGAVLFSTIKSELAPTEDNGAVMVMVTAPEGSTIRYTDHYVRQIETLFRQIPEIDSYFTWVAGGLSPALVTKGGSWINLTDWSARKRTQQEIVAELVPKLAQVPGVEASAQNPATLGGTGSPVQVVIGGMSYEELEQSVGRMLERAKAYPGLTNPEAQISLNKPELDVHVHRNKAADLGISVAAIGRTLQTLLGGRHVTTFDREGKEYPVIIKVDDSDRVKPSDIHSLYVKGRQGELVQLSNLVTVEETVTPRELTHYDKVRSATMTAGVGPGYSLGEALEYLEDASREILPAGIPMKYTGQSRTFKQASIGLYLTFAVAFLMIYLVLAAQFDSFLHPVTILLSVPPAITGALLTLMLIGGTMNVFSQIGMIMLIGLVSKNAILIVDFANRLRSRGMALMPAVIEAAVLRLRPIAMTTLATILGALPLAMATGAGAAGRRQIGYVIVGGMVFSTVLALFIVPAMYTVLSRHAVKRNDSWVEGARPKMKPEPVGSLRMDS
ncbi:MAG: efflux RND transporter permease subunit, partial [Nitrospiraceae bacterium]|nr:efflux RND transporter permease subunit [Nitrospiraceae bacterium]